MRSMLMILAAACGTATFAACAHDERELVGVTEQAQTEDAGGDAAADDLADEDAAPSCADLDDGGAHDEDAGCAPHADGGAHDEDAGIDPGPSPFTKVEAQALFDTHCTDCHGGAAGLSLEGDFTLTTVGRRSAQLPSMNLVTAGDRAQSYLLLKITGAHTTAGGVGARMPRGSAPLDDVDVERLARFIDGL